MRRELETNHIFCYFWDASSKGGLEITRGESVIRRRLFFPTRKATIKAIFKDLRSPFQDLYDWNGFLTWC